MYCNHSIRRLKITLPGFFTFAGLQGVLKALGDSLLASISLKLNNKRFSYFFFTCIVTIRKTNVTNKSNHAILNIKRQFIMRNMTYIDNVNNFNYIR